MVSLRLDKSVLEAFRASGKGWQSRINQVLSDFVKQV
ncbi:BrnA antitoxin family protein [Mannheimia haemolytica]